MLLAQHSIVRKLRAIVRRRSMSAFTLPMRASWKHILCMDTKGEKREQTFLCKRWVYNNPFFWQSVTMWQFYCKQPDCMVWPSFKLCELTNNLVRSCTSTESSVCVNKNRCNAHTNSHKLRFVPYTNRNLCFQESPIRSLTHRRELFSKS